MPYFHVVFTLPATIAAVAFGHKAIVYDLLFRTAADTLLTVAVDPKHLGAKIGLTAVLHTWGSTMTHHPHVHAIVPGGGLSRDGSRWVACRPAFFLPVRVLSRLFRRPFSGPEAVLACLSRYTHRVAISTTTGSARTTSAASRSAGRTTGPGTARRGASGSRR